MKIEEFPQGTGLPAKTIRYYESIGLLAALHRAPNGYREYKADGLLLTLEPSAQNVKALRWFSILTPAVLYLTYFITLLVTDHVWWNPNMWLGIIFFSGILGLGLSWLAFPPYEPDAASDIQDKTGP